MKIADAVQRKWPVGIGLIKDRSGRSADIRVLLITIKKTENNRITSVLHSPSFTSIGFYRRTFRRNEEQASCPCLLSRGSVDLSKNFTKVREDPEPSDPYSSELGWCVCGVCRRMPDERENVCSRRRTCVTSCAIFSNINLDQEVLVLAIRARCDIRADVPNYSTNSYRKAAYRQYVLFKYGKLGSGNLRVVPSCVVLTIRRVSWHQMGFTWDFGSPRVEVEKKL